MPTVISDNQILFGQLKLLLEAMDSSPQCHNIKDNTPIAKYDKQVHGVVTLSNSSGEWELVDGYARVKAMIAGGVPDETVIEYKTV